MNIRRELSDMWHQSGPYDIGTDTEAIELFLKRAAPLIASKALDDAADAFDDLRMDRDATRIMPGTWEYFELFPLQHLRDRAEAMRAAE